MNEIENTFYNEIRAILQQARKKAYSAINSAMVEAYWLIGKRIVEEEQKGLERADYGTLLIKNLSITLSAEYGKGFSIANLKNFRQFYLTFKDDKKSYTLCSQVSWSHIRLIMRLDNLKGREYYLKESKSQGWSVRQLQRNINSHYYERLLSTPAKENKPAIKQKNLREFIKDPYVLEFLNLPEYPALKESAVEQAIINNLRAFLRAFLRKIIFNYAIGTNCPRVNSANN